MASSRASRRARVAGTLQRAFEEDVPRRQVSAPVEATRIAVVDGHVDAGEDFHPVAVAQGGQGVVFLIVGRNEVGQPHSARSSEPPAAGLNGFEFEFQRSGEGLDQRRAAEPAGETHSFAQVEFPGGQPAVDAGGGDGGGIEADGGAAEQEKSRQRAGEARAQPAPPERHRTGSERQCRQPEQGLGRVVDVDEQRQPGSIGRRQPEDRKPHR
jgi:hypothetical protein